MILSQISTNQGPLNLNRATQTTSFALRDSGADNGASPPKDDQAESGVVVSKTYYEFTKLQDAKSTFNSVAANIRVAESTMGIIEDQMNRMKDKLEEYVKNFPPFSPGSEERVKLLKSFNAFRKQIDEMTIPPDYGDDIPESDAESKSIEIKHTLASESGMSLTETPKQLIDSLNI